MANNEYLNKNFLDNYGTSWLFDILTPNSGSFVFKNIDDDSIQIVNKSKNIPIWNNNQPILSYVYTASQSEPNYKDYTLNVYSTKSCGTQTKEFTIEYGHRTGYGTTYDYITEKTETKAIYQKYKHLLNDDVYNEYDQIYAIKFNKFGVQDEIYSDYFTIKLTNPYTSSLYSSLINYNYFLSQSSYDIINQEVVDLVSGSLENGIYYENASPIKFGRLYPKQSIVILNPDILNQYLNLGIQTNFDSNEKNAEKLYFSISESIFNMNKQDYKYWGLINATFIKNVINFPVLIPTNYFNYTNNPTYHYEIGKVKNLEFVKDPTSYFTTIGFYNNKYELLAVAKLSKPFKKTFTEQYVFDVNIEIT